MARIVIEEWMKMDIRVLLSVGVNKKRCATLFDISLKQLNYIVEGW